MSNVRDPYVAGHFYPGEMQELSRVVRSMLDEAPAFDGPIPKALIVPHAGYVYSGPVAAAAYACLEPYRDVYRRVVIVGPCHRLPVHRLALSDRDAFRTPLGDVPLDSAPIAELDVRGVDVFESMHEYEHSLEVQLPFLQVALGGEFSIVPVLTGDTSAESVASLLETLWDGPATLIVVSSDLSHYLSFEEAKAVDAVTCRAIENFDAQRIRHSHACGYTAVSGLLLAARRHGLEVRTIDMRNSGETAGDKSCVVGYGAWVFGKWGERADTG